MTGSSAPAGFERTLKIKSEKKRLADVRRFVDEITEGLPLDAERVFDLKVAVSEACANAIKHAGKETPALEITAVRTHDRLTFTVSDNGQFRTPSSVSADGESRGLGMPLMVALTDEVTFTRETGRGTTVRLSVRF